MGTNIREIVSKKEIAFEDLRGKVLAIDTYNMLYQFLSSIRQMDGSPLRDSKGNVTSHLTGLFSRTTRLMSYGMRLVFVFDGKPPELKSSEIERRKELKEQAIEKYKAAEAAEDMDEMRKYASRTSKLTAEMITESKELIAALGCPIVQAPSEGEAQAAYMVAKGDAYAVVSEDYDSLIYGGKRTIKNLTISSRKKERGKLSYESLKPSMIVLEDTLKENGITLDQLRIIAILCGTDFNPKGVMGIGQKKALKLVKEHGDDFEALFKALSAEKELSFDWKEVMDVISAIPHTDDYVLSWDKIDDERVFALLVEKHDFGKERIEATLMKLAEDKKTREQKGLNEFFG